MNFEGIVVSLVAILYFSVAISFGLKGNYQWAIIYGAYTAANVGLILAANK